MSCRAASRQAASRRVVPPTADERQLGSGGGGGVHRGRRQSSGSSIACLREGACAERGRCPSAHHPFSRVYNSIHFYTVSACELTKHGHQPLDTLASTIHTCRLLLGPLGPMRAHRARWQNRSPKMCVCEVRHTRAPYNWGTQVQSLVSTHAPPTQGGACSRWEIRLRLLLYLRTGGSRVRRHV